jgi:predicted RNase H-like nuclease (RuvC/YqgF family)
MAGKASQGQGNCFDEFNDISQNKKDPTIQTLYEYEKHYMEMLKKYKNEIDFIQEKLHDNRREREEFYSKILPDISDKLSKDEGIDDKMKQNWLNRLTENIERSFEFSENLINDYAIKNLNEFKKEVDEKLRNI